MRLEQEELTDNFSSLSTLRPFYAGIVGGLVGAAALALPLYFVLPARYTTDWYDVSPVLGIVGYVFAALIATGSGYVAARWGWASTLRERMGTGAVAGALVGMIAWLLVGAGAAGVMGHEPIWLHGPRQAGEDELLILLSEAVVRSGVLPHVMFWILIVAGTALGGAGGLVTIWKRSVSWGTAPRPIHRSVWLAVAFSLFLIATLMLPVTMGILTVLTHQVESAAFEAQHTLSFPSESILWLPIFIDTLTLILSLVWIWKQIGDWRSHPHSDSTIMVATISAFILFIHPLLWFYLILVNPALVSGTNVLVPVTVIALNLMGAYWAWIATSEGPSAVAVPDMTWRDLLAYVFLTWPLCSIVFMLGVGAHATSLVLGAIPFIGVLSDGTDRIIPTVAGSISNIILFIATGSFVVGLLTALFFLPILWTLKTLLIPHHRNANWLPWFKANGISGPISMMTGWICAGIVGAVYPETLFLGITALGGSAIVFGVSQWLMVRNRMQHAAQLGVMSSISGMVIGPLLSWIMVNFLFTFLFLENFPFFNAATLPIFVPAAGFAGGFVLFWVHHWRARHSWSQTLSSIFQVRVGFAIISMIALGWLISFLWGVFSGTHLPFYGYVLLPLFVLTHSLTAVYIATYISITGVVLLEILMRPFWYYALPFWNIISIQHKLLLLPTLLILFALAGSSIGFAVHTYQAAERLRDYQLQEEMQRVVEVLNQRWDDVFASAVIVSESPSLRSSFSNEPTPARLQSAIAEVLEEQASSLQKSYPIERVVILDSERQELVNVFVSPTDTSQIDLRPSDVDLVSPLHCDDTQSRATVLHDRERADSTTDTDGAELPDRTTTVFVACSPVLVPSEDGIDVPVGFVYTSTDVPTVLEHVRRSQDISSTIEMRPGDPPVSALDESILGSSAAPTTNDGLRTVGEERILTHRLTLDEPAGDGSSLSDGTSQNPSSAAPTSMEVILRLQEQTIDHDLGAGFQVMVLANLLTFLFLLSIGAGMSRSFTRPILKLSDAAQAVAKGDLDQRVPVTTKDEIGTLSESFNMMIEGLQQREAAERERQAAEAANHAKSAFLANMSHELRTPLNAILGFTQLMSRDQRLMPDQRENLSVINRSGEHLLALINDVLEMSKIEAGRTTLVEHTFDLHYMLDGLEEMFHLKAANKGLHLIAERTPDVPRSVCTDEGKLRQVLMNLLSNAIKFTEDGGVIVRVTSEEKADQEPNDGRAPASAQQLLFEIEDTGVGIAQDEISQLFDAFVQTSSGRQSQEGTGLGLPISRQFVRLMGGDIHVRSQPGEGSTFAFHIQVYLADSVATQTTLPARTVVSLASDQPGYRILIVDDRWPSRQLLSKLLLPLGFEIREVSNGQECLDVWETWEPHLIFMDMRMPVMDGYEATRRIKSTLRGQSTIIIALTASAFEEDRAIVLSAGCDDFIRKPFREAVIFEVLTRHLGVQFVYADEAAREHAKNRAAETALSPGDLRGLPDGWVRDLQQAAVQGDTDLLFRLIEHIREQHPALAERLTTLAHNYQFEPIIDAATDQFQP